MIWVEKYELLRSKAAKYPSASSFARSSSQQVARYSRANKLVILLIILLLIAVLKNSQLKHSSVQDYVSVQTEPATSKPEVKAVSNNKTAGELIVITPNPWPEFNYSIPFGEGYSLQVNLKIDAITKPPPSAYWCGAPFHLDYKGKAQATITNQTGEAKDQIDLTSPSLVLGKAPNYNFYYYEPYDLDGDGEKGEFIVLTYFSCNGNWVKIIKADRDKHTFVPILFQLDGATVEEVLANPNKKDLIVNKGKITTKSYNMFDGVVYANTFVYREGVFIQVDRKVQE